MPTNPARIAPVRALSSRWGLAVLLGSVAASAAPAAAAISPASVAANAYVRARAADAMGELQASASGYAAAMTLTPGDTALAVRAYRAALGAGDHQLALRALRTLEAAHMVPIDGRLLLLADAFGTRDWARATAVADAIDKEGVFSFILPPVRAWIAYGARTGDPLAPLAPPPPPLVLPSPGAAPGAPGAAAQPAPAAPPPIALATASPYAAEHRAFMLLALGRTEEGVAATRALAGPGGNPPPLRLRLLAASALQREGQRDRALALLDGEDATLAAARARLTAGQPLLPAAYSAADGLADLYVHIAIDVNRQRVSPLSITLARMAAFLAPANPTTWLMVGDVLAQSDQPRQAIAALGNIPSTDLFADAASGTRIRLLIAADDKPTALAEAQARVVRGQPGTTDWMRLGDLYTDLDRPRDAADAYAKALARAEADKDGNDGLWPILMLQGGALDKAGDWPGGRAALRRALSLAPDQAVVLNYLGYAQLERRENVAEARGLIERASKIKPEDPSITDSLGWSYYLTGDLPRAIEALERASQGNPAEATISEHLGDAYWKVGRRYEARYAWRAALVTAEAPDGSRIRAKIDAGLTDRTAAP